MFDRITKLMARWYFRNAYQPVALDPSSRLITRPDNAAYLRETFGDRPDLLQAADRFAEAGQAYQAALAAVANRGVGRSVAAAVAGWLRQTAAAERAAGQIFLAQA